MVSLPLLLPFVQAELHLGLSQVGLLGTMLNSLSVLLALPAGVIAAKFGGLRSLIIAMAIYSLGFIFTALAPSYALIIIAFLLAGLGFGIFHPIAFAEVARLTNKSDRGRAMGSFTAVGDLGRVGISAAITLIASYIGWRATSGLYGAVGLGLFALLFRFSNKKQIVETPNVSPVSLGFLLKHPKFLSVTLTNMLDTFASSSLFVFIPFLLIEKGIGTAILGTLTAFFFVGNMFGKTMLGRFVDKVGSLKVFATAEILMAMAIALFTVIDNWILIAIVAVLLGALTKGTVPVIKTMVADIVDTEHSFEQVFALNSLLSSLAGAAAPLLLGLAAQSLGINYVFIISAIFALLAAASTLGIKLVNVRLNG